MRLRDSMSQFFGPSIPRSHKLPSSLDLPFASANGNARYCQLPTVRSRQDDWQRARVSVDEGMWILAEGRQRPY